MNPLPSRTVRKWIFPLDRRLCSQPLMVTSSPSWVPMSSIYTCITSSSVVGRESWSLVSEQPFHVLASASGSSEYVFGRPQAADFEHQRTVVADLLHGRERRGPVHRALEWHEVIVDADAVVVHVDREHVFRHDLERLADVALEVRVA